MLQVLLLAGLTSAAVIETVLKGHTSSSTLPEYFQTTPEWYPGPTPTGQAAFLAQTNPAPFPSVSYTPPEPLETQVPINGSNGRSMFKLMGHLSHYFPNPSGFGVDEHPLPKGANITGLHMLSRHGARYPTGFFGLVEKLQTNEYEASGPLDFLNNWTYKLGEQILVPVGKEELFESGVLHQYNYGSLYNNNGSRIIARTTSQDRMLKSAEYFMAGFFGLDWTQNVTLEVIREQWGFNNSLAGAEVCNNSISYQSMGGRNATLEWQSIYLREAYDRISPFLKFTNASIPFTISDIYTLQNLCAYETVALGYSSFCPLFTYAEWEGFEYSIDLYFAGTSAFQSPTGRAVGIGWVQELRARLQHRYLREAETAGSANTTLDAGPDTFPLDQPLYFDFSHDTNIMSVLTALGLRQFAAVLPATHIPAQRDLIVSHVTPFAARLDLEIIRTPRPLAARRPATYDDDGGETTYVHLLLNQRTVPLGVSHPEHCGDRDDGWCELGAFLSATEDAFELSMYEEACYGDYPAVPYGEVLDGNPGKSEGRGNGEGEEEPVRGEL